MKEWLEEALSDPKQTSLFDEARGLVKHSPEAFEFDLTSGDAPLDSFSTELNELRELSRQPITKCTLCGGRSKVYAYKMGSYARVLCWLAYMDTKKSNLPSYVHKRESLRRYHHVPSSGAINGGGDYAKLRYWGLIERMPKEPEQDKRSSGMWRLTKIGRRFVYGQITVSSVCYYRHPEGGVLGFETEQIGIEDALGKNFSYRSLMAGYTQNKIKSPK